MQATLPPVIELMPPSWDELCERGRTAREDIDAARWTIGDLALDVRMQYSQDRLKEFADEINVERARVKEYRTVCRFYEKAARASFLADRPTLTYSHLRDAMRLGAADRAYTFLDEAASNTWTVGTARLKLAERLGKPVPPPKLLDAAPCRIVGASGQFEITFRFDDSEMVKRLRSLYFSQQTAVVMTLAGA